MLSPSSHRAASDYLRPIFFIFHGHHFHRSTKMNDEKLIELVRGHSVLYDLSHPNYMNTDFKNIIWAKIAEEMETTGKKYNNNYF